MIGTSATVSVTVVVTDPPELVSVTGNEKFCGRLVSAGFAFCGLRVIAPVEVLIDTQLGAVLPAPRLVVPSA